MTNGSMFAYVNDTRNFFSWYSFLRVECGWVSSCVEIYSSCSRLWSNMTFFCKEETVHPPFDLQFLQTTIPGSSVGISSMADCKYFCLYIVFSYSYSCCVVSMCNVSTQVWQKKNCLFLALYWIIYVFKGDTIKHLLFNIFCAVDSNVCKNTKNWFMYDVYMMMEY